MIEGALLRLRPKVMTVSTIVVGLLPIIWSTSAGSEVMKPLATPVFGGMVSSLLHVLIVTPVIFYWLRLRELKKQGPVSSGTDGEGHFAFERGAVDSGDGARPEAEAEEIASR